MRTLEPYSTNPAGFRRAWTRDTLRWVGAGTGAKGKGAGDGSEDEDDEVSWTSRRIKYWQWKSWKNTTRCTNAFRFLPEAILNHLVEMYFGFPHVYLMSTSSPVSPNYTDFSASSSEFTADSIRSPLDNAFDFRQNYPREEFFAYHYLPWSSPVEPKKALYSIQGYYAPAVSVYVSQQQQQQQIHAPLPSHDLAAAADDWRAQQAYRPAPKSDYPATSAHQIMCTTSSTAAAAVAVCSAATAPTPRMGTSSRSSTSTHLPRRRRRAPGTRPRTPPPPRRSCMRRTPRLPRSRTSPPCPACTRTHTLSSTRTRPTRTPTRSPTRSRTRPRSTPRRSSRPRPSTRAACSSPPRTTPPLPPGRTPPRRTGTRLRTRPPSARTPSGAYAAAPRTRRCSTSSHSARTSGIFALPCHRQREQHQQRQLALLPVARCGLSFCRRERLRVPRRRGPDGDFLPPGARRRAPQGRSSRYAPYVYSPSPSTSTGTSGSYGYDGYAYEGMVPLHGHGYLDAEFLGDAGGGGGGGGGAGGRRTRMRPTAALPVPVPVPNLTKKSRGRRVPTVQSLYGAQEFGGRGRAGSTGSKAQARLYTCKVLGCGKCFARGEHLKRHVRSIHTYEKPHKCPYPGCGKDFSRHDNLGQYMRVQKDFVRV